MVRVESDHVSLGTPHVLKDCGYCLGRTLAITVLIRHAAAIQRGVRALELPLIEVDVEVVEGKTILIHITMTVIRGGPNKNRSEWMHLTKAPDNNWNRLGITKKRRPQVIRLSCSVIRACGLKEQKSAFWRGIDNSSSTTTQMSRNEENTKQWTVVSRHD